MRAIDSNDSTRLPHLYEGFVIDIDDPLRLRRVRVEIPGICSDTGWARPRTMGGGGPQRGGHVLPEKGHTVWVQFVNGEVSKAVYDSAAWGTPDAGSEMPTDILAAGAEGTKVSSLEFSRGDISVRFTIDERDGNRSWRVVAMQKSESGEQALGSIELDIEKRVLDLFGLAGVRVRSLGLVEVVSKGLVKLQGRRVRRTPAQI